jgi:Uri superfamily endonuclease
MKNDHDGNGTYILILYRKRGKTIKVGSLGAVHFKKGYYAYVGSAMNKNGIYNRVGRHIRSEKLTKWHVDHLKLPVREVWISDFGVKCEWDWAKALGEVASEEVSNFGSTDSKCKSHLLFFKSSAILKESMKEFCKSQQLKSVKISIPFNLKSESVQLPKVFQLINQ